MRLSKCGILDKLKGKVMSGHVNEENVKETLRWYDKQIEKNSKDTGLYYAKAALLAKEGRYEESILTLDRIIELDPDNEKVWFIKANTLFELMRYEEAIKCFDRILEFAEDDEKVWFHKGEALSKLERYREAIVCFDKAISLDRNYTEAWLGRGNALRKLRSHNLNDEPEILDEERKVELENALESYIIVTELDPNREQGWHGRGGSLHDLHRYEEALPFFERCIEINPNFIKAWYDKGKALLKLDRKEEARQSFETAVGFVPNDILMTDPEDLCARANAFYELGRYDEAIDCFDEILEKYPNSHYALESKGAMLEMLGRNQEALRLYKKAIDMNSNNVSTWYKLGNLLSDAGDYDAAVKSYNEAVQLALGFEDAWYRIGELLRMQKDIKKAEECFSWILEINPNNVRAKKALLTLTKNNKNIHGKRYDFQTESQKGPKKRKLLKFRRKRLKRKLKNVEEKFLEEETKKDVGKSEDELTIVAPSNLGTFTSKQNAMEKEDLSDIYEEIYADLDELVSLLNQKSVHLDGQSYEDVQSGEVRLDANSLENTQSRMVLLEPHSVTDIIPNKRLMDTDDVNDMVTNEVSVDKLIIVGREHLKRKEFEKALGCFNRALKLDPNHLDAWIAKGDVLLEMNKIPGASSCYKKGVVNPQNQINVVGNKVTPVHGSIDSRWKDTLISFLKNIYEDLEKSKKPNFKCPNCGSKVNLDEKRCPGCNITFLVERLNNNYNNVEDDLIFFDKLKRILSAKIPTFIHLDDSNGVISFLEKRKNDKTGRFDYVLVRGDIEKLG